MDPISTLIVLALLAAIVVSGFAVWAAVETALTARQARVSLSETTTRLVPLLEKADVTVDAVNAELLRIDGIITQFEEAGAKVSQASGTISGIVNAPAEIVTGVSGKVRRAWRDRKRAAEQAEHDAESRETEAPMNVPSESHEHTED